jgi:hypothetical protein
MKQLIIYFLIFLLCGEVLNAQKKHALIIAVGDYPIESGWKKISSENDVPLISSFLKRQGFKEKNIKILENEQATKKGIVAGFENLTKNTETGDIVHIHFSGHGQQIMDNNGDELDGYDESIIPYDAGMDYENCPAKGENHFRDDELSVYLNAIRVRIGPEGDLIVTIDACHSGTATRGIGLSRGTTVKFAPQDYSPEFDYLKRENQSFLEANDGQHLSPIVIFSGSSASEQNFEYTFEGKSYGSLSYALSTVMMQTDTNITYRGIFGKIQGMMSAIAPRQNPQIEGEADRKIFGGQSVAQTAFTVVKYWIDSTKLVLEAGKLNGITNNSSVEFYPVGTTKPDKIVLLNTGTVVNAQLGEAVVLLGKPMKEEAAYESWAFVRSINIGDISVGVKIAGTIPDSIGRLIRSEVTTAKHLHEAESKPGISLLTDDSKENEIYLITHDDFVLKRFIIEDYSATTLASEVITQINRYTQVILLKKLEAVNSRIRVGMEIIPVVFDERFEETGRTAMDKRRNDQGHLIFEEGEYFKIKLTNYGQKRAYYTLISIQADNSVNVLIPERDVNGNLYRSAADCFIDAGVTEELGAVFYFGKPYGQEVFKLVSSSKPMQLQQLSETRGSENVDRTVFNDFELLFSSDFEHHRSFESYRLPPEFIHIETLVFEVIDPR